MESFDETKYALGDLCKYEHKYEGTEQSLRYIYRGKVTNCVVCTRARVRKWSKNNPDRHKELSEQSRIRTRDSRVQRKRERYAAKKPERQIVADTKRRLKDKEKELFGIQINFMNSELGIDTTVYTLGKRCKHEHEYENTGLSLRYLRDANQCVECRRDSRARNMSRKTYRVRKRQAKMLPYTFDDLKARLIDFDFKCAYCQKELIFDTKLVSCDDYLNWDHVHPISAGGIDALANLLPACRICNLSKAKRLFNVWYTPDNAVFDTSRLNKIQSVLPWLDKRTGATGETNVTSVFMK
jgi:5-methylcytosine-specific restriction endonuclease McrA